MAAAKTRLPDLGNHIALHYTCIKLTLQLNQCQVDLDSIDLSPVDLVISLATGTGARFLKSLTSLPHKVRASFGGSTEQQPERKKKEKKHHWMSRGTGMWSHPLAYNYIINITLHEMKNLSRNTNFEHVTFSMLTSRITFVEKMSDIAACFHLHL